MRPHPGRRATARPRAARPGAGWTQARPRARRPGRRAPRQRSPRRLDLDGWPRPAASPATAAASPRGASRHRRRPGRARTGRGAREARPGGRDRRPPRPPRASPRRSRSEPPGRSRSATYRLQPLDVAPLHVAGTGAPAGRHRHGPPRLSSTRSSTSGAPVRRRARAHPTTCSTSAGAALGRLDETGHVRVRLTRTHARASVRARPRRRGVRAAVTFPRRHRRQHRLIVERSHRFADRREGVPAAFDVALRHLVVRRPRRRPTANPSSPRCSRLADLRVPGPDRRARRIRLHLRHAHARRHQVGRRSASSSRRARRSPCSTATPPRRVCSSSRSQLPANYRIPAHSHPTDEVVTVLQRDAPGRDGRQARPG